MIRDPATEVHEMRRISEKGRRSSYPFARALVSLAATIAVVQLLDAHVLQSALPRTPQSVRLVVENFVGPLVIAGAAALIAWCNLTSHSVVKRRYAFLAGLIIACVVLAWDLVLDQSTQVAASMLGATNSLLFKTLSLCAVTLPPIAWTLWLGSNAEMPPEEREPSLAAPSSIFQPHVLVLSGVVALLAFFVVVGLATTFLWSHERQKIEGYAELINLSGRQRMFTQKIGRYAALLEHKREQRYADGLREVKSLMISEAQRLEERISALSTMDGGNREPRLLSRMAELRSALWQQVDRVLQGADPLSGARVAEVQRASDAFADAMERVVSAFGRSANERVLQTTERITSFGIALIFILVTGTLSIVLPIAWVVRHQHRILDRHARMLDEARAEAQKTLNELAAYQAALSKKAIISVTDRAGRIEAVNDLFCRISKYEPEELIGRNHRIVNSGDHSPEFFADMWRTIERGELWTNDICNRAKDGTKYWVDTTIVPIRDKGGQIRQFLSVRYDITARKYEREALKESEAHLNRAQAVAKVGSWSIDLASRELRWSNETYRIFGMPAGTPLTYAMLLEAVHADDRTFVDAAWRSALKGKDYSIEHRIVVDGAVRHVHERADFEFDGAGRALRAVGTVQDITERKSTEAKLMWQAQYDILTELPNRRLFQDRLETALEGRRRDGRIGAILMIDLDHFKDVNDSLGHKAGDDVLIATAERLRASVRDGDTIARFGGDEFLVLLDVVESADDASHIAARIQGALARPFETEQRDLHLGSSIGICVFPSDGATVDEVLIFADAAMYAAKHAGRKSVCFYTPSINEELRDRISLAEELHAALEEGQLCLVFQPIVDIASRRIEKCEALIRWRHPAKGLLLPGQFMPVAEAYGLMPEIESWVIEEVVRRYEEWRRDGLDLQISVNISAKYLRSESKVTELRHTLGRRPADARGIILEITESHLMRDEGTQLDHVARLVEAGAEIAIDDFGTGYSSLSYLTRIPAKYLKIDRSFVAGLRSTLQQRLVKSVIGIAHDVGMRVVAEGVESHEQLALLAAYECDFVQGYLFSRPLSEGDFRQYIGSHRDQAPSSEQPSHAQATPPDRQRAG